MPAVIGRFDLIRVMVNLKTLLDKKQALVASLQQLGAEPVNSAAGVVSVSSCAAVPTLQRGHVLVPEFICFVQDIARIDTCGTVFAALQATNASIEAALRAMRVLARQNVRLCPVAV